MADLVRQLPGHARKTVRRRLNQLDRLGVEVRAAGAGEADRAVADLLRLHALQWHGRAVNPEHLRPAFARHLAGAAGGMIDSGQAALLEYRVAGRLVASSLVVVCTDLAGGYLSGAHPDLREQADVTTLLLSSTLDLAHRLGCSTLSMLRGTEPYKLRWRPREAVNRRLLLARPGSRRALAYAAGVRARAGAIRLADERLPSLRAAHAAGRQVAARLTAGPVR
jgi:hypothetical protein